MSIFSRVRLCKLIIRRIMDISPLCERGNLGDFGGVVAGAQGLVTDCQFVR
jgi:hypothetical protein